MISVAVLELENNTKVGLAPIMASAGAQAYKGGPGQEPQVRVKGKESVVGGHGGTAPLKLVAF